MAFGSELCSMSAALKDVGVVEWGLTFCAM